MRKLLLCAPFLLATLAAQTTSPAPSTFRSEALHFTYTYPAGLQPNEQLTASITQGMAGDPNDSDHQQWVKCATVPLVAAKGLDRSPGSSFGMLVLLRVDHACMGVNNSFDRLGELAQMLMQVLKGFGRPLTEDARPYKLDGHDAWFVQGSVAAKAFGQDTNLHAASTCALVAGNSLCWLLLDSNHKLMPALIASPVTFDCHPATPLIPADLPQPW